MGDTPSIHLANGESGRRRRAMLILAVAAIAGGTIAVAFLRPVFSAGPRLARLRAYFRDPEGFAEATIQAGARCGDAPFLMPTDGYIGFFWGDSFRPGHRHQGIDVFGPPGGGKLGTVPVVASYDGYLTRLSTWRSAVILRVPEDPLRPDRQIWLYYTHMADPQGRSFIVEDFPPGTAEAFVEAGTLLGYQGNYSADPDNPTGMHLHFSIVLDDGRGGFRNELQIENTLDPSPYLGLEVNAERAGDAIAACRQG